MIVLYTSPGCASCRKVRNWLKENDFKFIEKNIFTTQLQENEIKYLLLRSENGSEDIISKRSKVVINSKIEIDEMKVEELVHFVINNPSVLKRPIIVSENNFLIGYDVEEIEVLNKYKRKIQRIMEGVDSCDSLLEFDSNKLTEIRT